MQEDITPADSVAPVYLDTTPMVPPEIPVFNDTSGVDSALAKLQSPVYIPLTVEEARALAGLSANAP